MTARSQSKQAGSCTATGGCSPAAGERPNSYSNASKAQEPSKPATNGTAQIDEPTSQTGGGMPQKGELDRTRTHNIEKPI